MPLIKLIVLFTFAMLFNSSYAAENQWQKTSEAKHFTITIAPQQGRYTIGEYHQWIIEVKNSAAKPVENAQITMGGGMVGHGHDLPSQPVVTRYLGEGKYLIEGVLFNMMGDWTLLFAIQTPSVADRVRFDIALTF